MTVTKRTLDVSEEGSVTNNGEQDFDDQRNPHREVSQFRPALRWWVFDGSLDQKRTVVAHERWRVRRKKRI